VTRILLDSTTKPDGSLEIKVRAASNYDGTIRRRGFGDPAYRWEVTGNGLFVSGGAVSEAEAKQHIRTAVKEFESARAEVAR
jgi:hypothetical protein